jgi:hypothetical protein
MPRNDLKITKELGGEELKAVAEKYMKWHFTRPSMRLWEGAGPNPDRAAAKAAYESALSSVPLSQRKEVSAMAEEMIQAKLRGLKNRGSAGRSGMTPTRGDM